MVCDQNPVAKCAAESDRGEKKSSPLHVIHKPRESLLSCPEPTTNYKGFVSFCVVILVSGAIARHANKSGRWDVGSKRRDFRESTRVSFPFEPLSYTSELLEQSA